MKPSRSRATSAPWTASIEWRPIGASKRTHAPGSASRRLATTRPRSQRRVAGNLGCGGRRARVPGARRPAAARAGTTPRDAHHDPTGQSSQAGLAGRQTVAARSMTALTHPRGSSRSTSASAAAWPLAADEAVAADALEHAPNVDVEGCDGSPERGGGGRSGRVRSHAGQVLELGHALRNVAPVPILDAPRGLAQRERPAVVAQAGPGAKEVQGLGAGELGGPRPALHEATPRLPHPLDLRLLRHHLGDEHRPCRARGTDLQPAPAGLGPRTQRPIESDSVAHRGTG